MISENIDRLRAEVPKGVRIVAVSKLKPTDDVLTAYHCGQRLFGENYATELRSKAAALPSDIEWHFIGHMQAKQLKYYIGFVSMIHGVDSTEHLFDIEKAAAKAGRVVDCLLQLHIAQEESKFGFTAAELASLSIQPSELPHVRLRGLMAMASHVNDEEQVRNEFRSAHLLYDQLCTTPIGTHFDTLSMGMSHDWPIAVAEGSNMIRLGTSIFGPRDYSKK